MFCCEQCRTVSSECIATFLPHLLPTCMPQEVKKFVMKNNTFEITNIINLIMKANFLKQNTPSSARYKYHSMLQFNFRLFMGIRTLNNRVNTPLSLRSVSSLTALLQRAGRLLGIQDQFARIFLLEVNPKHIKFRQTFHAFQFVLSVPFTLHMNLTFAPVFRAENCSFVLCLIKVVRLEERKHCTTVCGFFEPWSVVLPTGQIKLAVHVTLLYNETHTCTHQLVKMIFQPVAAEMESQFFTSLRLSSSLNLYIKMLIERQLWKECTIPAHFPQMKSFSKRQYNARNLYVFRISLEVTEILIVGIAIQSYSQYCSSDQEPLYIFDGPGILSHKLSFQKSGKFLIYKASTFQVFVLKFGSPVKVQNCLIHFEGKNQKVKLVNIEQKDSVLSYHWMSNNSSSPPFCVKFNRGKSCKLHFEGNSSLLINITKLTKNNYVSFDDHIQADFHPSYRDTLGHCYFGVFAVGHKSTRQSRSAVFTMSHLCTVQADDTQQVSLSSAPGLSVMLFAYFPYSNIETKFKISAFSCVSVSIQLCAQADAGETKLLDTNEMEIWTLGKREDLNRRQIHVYSIKIKQAEKCLGLNLVASGIKFCSNYVVSLFSVSDMRVSGDLVIGHYELSPRHRASVQFNQGAKRFDLNVKNFNLYHNPSSFTLNLGHPYTKILSLVCSMLVVSSSPRHHVSKYSIVPSMEYLKLLPDLISDNVLNCYKLLLHGKEKQFSLRTKTLYSRDVYVSTGCEYPTRDNICFVEKTGYFFVMTLACRSRSKTFDTKRRKQISGFTERLM